MKTTSRIIARSSLMVLIGSSLLSGGAAGGSTQHPINQVSDDQAPLQVGAAPPPPGPQPPPTPVPRIGLTYGGGPVMVDHVNIYLMFYGKWNWGRNYKFGSNWNISAEDIVIDFVRNIAWSPYFNINNAYYQVSGGNIQRATSNIRLGGAIWNYYTDGNRIDEPYRTIATFFYPAIVTPLMGWGGGDYNLPADPHGIYVLLTSPDVDVAFPYFSVPSSCGYHYDHHFPIIVVPHPSRDAANCIPQAYSSPNGDVAADAIVNQIARLVSDTLTNPHVVDGWQIQDQLFQSPPIGTADVCAKSFGPLMTDVNGYYFFNLTLPSSIPGAGSRNYLVQQNWLPKDFSSGQCAMHP